MERLGGDGGGKDGEGEEMEKLEVPAKATELLRSLAWLIPGGLPLSPCTCWVCSAWAQQKERGEHREHLVEGACGWNAY